MLWDALTSVDENIGSLEWFIEEGQSYVTEITGSDPQLYPWLSSLHTISFSARLGIYLVPRQFVTLITERNDSETRRNAEVVH